MSDELEARVLRGIRSWMAEGHSEYWQFSTATRETLWMSDNVANVLGYTPAEALALGSALIHPDDLEVAYAAMQDDTTIANRFLVLRARHADGSWRIIEYVSHLVPDSPDSDLIIAARDVTDRMLVAEQQAESFSREYFCRVRDREFVLVVDAGGQVTYASPSVRSILGISPEVARDALGNYLHEDDRDRLLGMLTTLIGADGGATYGPAIGRAIAVDGTPRWLEFIASRRSVPDAMGVVVITLRDVTEREELNQRQEWLLSHDELTGLTNRRAFLNALQREPGADACAVVLCDLDRFKPVNDNLGHVAGDTVLRAVADRLAATAGAGELIARAASDEFLLLLRGIDNDHAAEAAAARLLTAVSEPVDVAGIPVDVRASLGVTVVAADDLLAPEEVLRRVDVAMLAAKRRGGNTVVTYDADLAEVDLRRRSLTPALRAAIGANELTVHYQPEVDIRTGAVVGVEALVRWQHPELGLLQAGAFVPLAEEAGLIERLGDSVLETACCDAAGWEAASLLGPEFVLRVNASAGQLGDPAFVDRVLGALERSGLAPHRLLLELTETALVLAPEGVRTAIARLGARGVGFDLDDFGTGYSSLSRLSSFDVGGVKIDRSFVAGVDTDPRSRTIVAAVYGMASSLGYRVVAEGVETDEQAAAIARLGVTHVQGWLYAAAMPAADLRGVLGQFRYPAVAVAPHAGGVRS